MSIRIRFQESQANRNTLTGGDALILFRRIKVLLGVKVSHRFSETGWFSILIGQNSVIFHLPCAFQPESFFSQVETHRLGFRMIERLQSFPILPPEHQAADSSGATATKPRKLWTTDGVDGDPNSMSILL